MFSNQLALRKTGFTVPRIIRAYVYRSAETPKHRDCQRTHEYI
jgi:hypothetical protein